MTLLDVALPFLKITKALTAHVFTRGRQMRWSVAMVVGAICIVEGSGTLPS